MNLRKTRGISPSDRWILKMSPRKGESRLVEERVFHSAYLRWYSHPRVVEDILDSVVNEIFCQLAP